MKKEEIKEKVIEIVTELLGLIPGEAEDDSSFEIDLGADSLDGVELIMEIEKEFNINIPDDQAESATTVISLVNLVDKIVTNKK